MAKKSKPVDPGNSGDDNDPIPVPDQNDVVVPIENAQLIIDQGLNDLQIAIYEHASRMKPRLARLDKIVDLVETRIFQPDMLEALPSKELVKLLELLTSSQVQAAGFLERLYKLTIQKQQDVEIVKLSKQYALASDGAITEKSAARLKISPERKSLLLKVIEQNLVDENDFDDED
jgi:hypothetical protein